VQRGALDYTANNLILAQAGAPISGLASEGCDGDYHYLCVPNGVNHRQLELARKHPAGSKLERKTHLGKLCNQRLGLLDCLIEALAQLGAHRREIDNFMEEFVPRRLEVPDRLHRL